MAKEMLINVSAGEECRIALLEDDKLQELYMERTSATSHVGNIYKGKVTNVEPSIQAAFVDFGIGRNGFLHISDLMPSYFGKKGGDVTEPVGRKLGRRDRPPIQQCLRKGDEIIVQIIKEGIGTKGPTLSSYLSIPGRVLVMMPGMSKMGISKKIEDEEERLRLRKILDGLKPPKDCGFIIRTAGIGKSKLEIERDLKYLARLWETLKKKIDKDKPPVELYTEGDLVTRTVRDVFTSDVDRIIVDDKDTAKKVKDFIKLAMPRTKNKVDLYEEAVPLFHKYEIEGEIEGIYSRRVPLPSGGSLIIDQTEAIVAIDVNSGKFRDHSDAETTAFKTDLEAADEIPRQLKLRDMGGVIICDFIDLRFERHRREVEERLHNNLKNDRAKTRMLRMSHFGIIEMTRQRMRPSLKKSIYQECTACRAHGMVKTPESMSLDVMRKLRIALNDAAVVRVQLTVHPDVASYLQNRKRAELATLEDENQKRVIIAADPLLPTDEIKFELFDSRDGYIFISELGMALPAVPHGQPRSGSQRGGRGDRQQHKPKHDRQHEESEALDAEDLFNDEGEDKSKAKSGKAARPSNRKNGQAVEQTGGEDEASVVEIDEGGSELPGNAAAPFDDPRDDRRHNRRDRNRGRDQNRGREDRSRGGDRDDRNRQQQRKAEPAVAASGEDDFERLYDQHRPDGRGEQREQREQRGQAVNGQSNRPPRGDEPRNEGQGEGGGRRRRRRRGRRGRGRGQGGENQGGQEGNLGENRGNAVAGARPPADEFDFEEDSDRPAPGNSITDPTSPQEQLALRDERAAGGGRGRRGRRGRGRGQQGGRQSGRQQPAFDRTGLPDDEELEREARALEEAQAALAAEASTAQPIDEIDAGDDADKPDTRSQADITTPPPEQAPDEMDVPPSSTPVRSGRRSASAKRVPPQPEVIKTGSSDKHLADDEPVDAETSYKRPQSYSDLDELPDFDE